jgi:hypothetical protein
MRSGLLRWLVYSIAIWAAGTCPALADTKVVREVSRGTTTFEFKQIALPAVDDTGTRAKWSVIDGQLDTVGLFLRNRPNEVRSSPFMGCVLM